MKSRRMRVAAGALACVFAALTGGQAGAQMREREAVAKPATGFPTSRVAADPMAGKVTGIGVPRSDMGVPPYLGDDFGRDGGASEALRLKCADYLSKTGRVHPACQ